MSQSLEDPPIISRTTLIEQVPLLLMQQVHMKEKYERSEVFISLKYQS